MGVVHTDMRDAAEAMAQEFRRMYCLDDCLVLEMPPAVAAHAGPGALGAAYYAEN
jgi:fatty acid-binding protein DegV